MKICQNLQFCWTPCGCHTGRIQYNSGETAAAAICIQTYNTPLMERIQYRCNNPLCLKLHPHLQYTSDGTQKVQMQ